MRILEECNKTVGEYDEHAGGVQWRLSECMRVPEEYDENARGVQ